MAYTPGALVARIREVEGLIEELEARISAAERDHAATGLQSGDE